MKIALLAPATACLLAACSSSTTTSDPADGGSSGDDGGTSSSSSSSSSGSTTSSSSSTGGMMAAWGASCAQDADCAPGPKGAATEPATCGVDAMGNRRCFFMTTDAADCPAGSVFRLIANGSGNGACGFPK